MGRIIGYAALAFVMVCAAVVLFVGMGHASPAEAKTWHKAHHSHHVKHKHHYGRRVAVDGRGFVRGRLICAINTSRELRQAGKRVPLTWSSRDFLRIGHRISKAEARRYDIRFNYRRGGGHVQKRIS